MCLYPKLIKNRKYTPNKKNGGIIPPVSDERTTLVPIGCQKCIECRKKKAREWQVRLIEEVKENKNGKFVTLTFNNESILELAKEIKGIKGYELDNAIATLGVRRFLERWRKEYGKSIRHWLTTEIGHNGTENIHLHGIVWTNKDFENIRKHWKYGYVYPRNKEEIKKNYVNIKTVNYIIKYVTKVDLKHKYYKSIILCSHKPAIGHTYTKKYDSLKNKYKGKNTDQTYRTESGHKISLPIYWRNKIYSEEEREKLWLQMLDKEERWVCGVKVSVKDNYKAYDNILDHYREKNKRLGYGKDEDREEEKEKKLYEKERRNIQTLTRIQKAWAIKNKDLKEYDPKK